MAFGLSAGFASTTLAENKTAEAEFFCDEGFDDVEEYWNAGGSDGFYAGYLYCHACGGC